MKGAIIVKVYLKNVQIVSVNYKQNTGKTMRTKEAEMELILVEIGNYN